MFLPNRSICAVENDSKMYEFVAAPYLRLEFATGVSAYRVLLDGWVQKQFLRRFRCISV